MLLCYIENPSITKKYRIGKKNKSWIEFREARNHTRGNFASINFAVINHKNCVNHAPCYEVVTGKKAKQYCYLTDIMLSMRVKKNPQDPSDLASNH